MTPKPKTDEEIVFTIFSSTDKARLENLDKPEKELMFNSVVVGYHSAESELLPIINQQAEEIERLKKVETTLRTKFNGLVKSLEAALLMVKQAKSTVDFILESKRFQANIEIFISEAKKGGE